MYYADKAEGLARLMEERLGLRGKGFAAKTRRAGRLLPRWARREARLLLRAVELENAPKLAKQIDDARVERAVANLSKWLAAQDPGARRRARFLDFMAAIALVFVVTTALVISVLRWRGLI